MNRSREGGPEKMTMMIKMVMMVIVVVPTGGGDVDDHGDGDRGDDDGVMITTDLRAGSCEGGPEER